MHDIHYVRYYYQEIQVRRQFSNHRKAFSLEQDPPRACRAAGKALIYIVLTGNRDGQPGVMGVSNDQDLPEQGHTNIRQRGHEVWSKYN